MDKGQLLIILKYAGSTIAAVYGVYATLTDFKEKKNGKKVLSRKGYLGIALLLVSAIFSLSTSALKDYKDAKDAEARTTEEAKKRTEDLKKIEGIIAGLEVVKLQLEGAQTSLKDTFGKTTRISEDLNAQLGLSDIMSKRLTGAAETLLDTSKTTSALMRENTESISYIDVSLVLRIDPALIVDDKGQNIISSDLLTAFKAGSADTDEIVKQLKAHSSLIRTRAGQEVTLMSYLGKEAGKRPAFGFLPGIVMQNDLFAGSDRMSFFLISDKSDIFDSDDDELVCVVTYRSPPNRFSGVRKYKDLNGLSWGVYFRSESLAFTPRQIVLDVGQAGLMVRERLLLLSVEDLKLPQSVSAKLKDNKKGQFSGELVIPNSFF